MWLGTLKKLKKVGFTKLFIQAGFEFILQGSQYEDIVGLNYCKSPYVYILLGQSLQDSRN